MMEIRALTAAQWRQDWNRQWRFSPAKAGLWLVLLQLGFGALALWRLRPAAAGMTLAGAAVLMAAQSGSWSFMMAFLTGRTQLFGSRTLILVHVSAAPPLAMVVAAAFSGLFRRAWSMLLWAIALGLVIGWAAVPVLWSLGVLVGTLGHLAGLLALIGWVRLAPRALGAAWVLLLVLQVALIWYLVYQLGAGVEAADLEQVVRSLRGPAVGAVAALFAVPGLCMVLWLGAAPSRLGHAYREAWLRLQELGAAAARPRRSAWPRAAVPGPAGAIVAKEWVLTARNPATWFRLGALLLLALVMVPARSTLISLAAARHDLLVLGAGLGAVFFCFSELIAAGFSAEGHRLGLAVVTGIRPARLLAGKFLAVSPFALLAGLAAWAVSATVGDGSARQAAMAAAALAVGLGTAAIAVGGAACDAQVSEAAEEVDQVALSNLMEQVPRGIGGSLGLIGSGLWAGGCVWAIARAPGLWALLAPVPPLALWLGWWRLRDRLCLGNIK